MAEHFSGNNLGDQSETEIESYFDSLEFDHNELTPAKEQFFGSIFNKIKDTVKKRVVLAKKGVSQ